MRAILIDSDNNTFKEVDVEDSIKCFEEIVRSSFLDMRIRYIEGNKVEIFCGDDSALVKGNKVSAVNSKMEPMFWGNILITAVDDFECGMKSCDMSQELAAIVLRNIRMARTSDIITPFPVLFGCEA